MPIHGNLKYWTSKMYLDWLRLVENLLLRYFFINLLIKERQYPFLARFDLIPSMSLFKSVPIVANNKRAIYQTFS